MAYDVGMIGRIFFVRWHTPPTEMELAALLREVEQSRKLAGIHLLYLTVFPGDAPSPTEDERRWLDDFSRQVRPYIEHHYLVLEGEALKATLVINRTPWRDERGFTTISHSVEEALQHAAADQTLDVGPLLADARAQRLLS